jgi:hypothetical protein
MQKTIEAYDDYILEGLTFDYIGGANEWPELGHDWMRGIKFVETCRNCGLQRLSNEHGSCAFDEGEWIRPTPGCTEWKMRKALR